MVVRDWFREWFNTPYYHKLYFERDEAEAKQFVNRLLDFFNPKDNSSMLDVGCGRGRHSRLLASRGYSVTGFDISSESILYAKKFESNKLTFYQHDMRLPFWINYFDYAFNFFTSFGYFYTWREHNNAIRTISKSLKKKGIVVIDYLNSSYIEKNLVAKELKKIDNIEFHIERKQDNFHFYKKIVVIDPEIVKPLVFTERIAKFNLESFSRLLSLQNLKLIHVFGNYNLDTFREESSPRLIISASK